MEKKKSIAQGMTQLGSTLGQWDEGDGDSSPSSRKQVARRRTQASPSRRRSVDSADRRGRREGGAGEDSLVSTVKAFVGKTSTTVDKYEEARKKNKINRFFKGVRNIFPKRKKKNKKDNKRGASSDSESSQEDDGGRAKQSRTEERKEREIGRGKFQEKERKRIDEEKRQRERELEERRRKSKEGDESEDEEESDDVGEDEQDEEEEGSGEDRRKQLKKSKSMDRQKHLLKRAQSTPAARQEKEETASSGRGLERIRDKYKAKLEAKKLAALAELQREETEKEQERQRQLAKAEHAAIDSFLDRAAQRRRGTEERVGFRSRLETQRTVSSIDVKAKHEDGSDDEPRGQRADMKKEKGRGKEREKEREKETKGKEVVRAASSRATTRKDERTGTGAKVTTKAPATTTKRDVSKRSSAGIEQLGGSMGSLGASAAVGGAKLVGRFVKQKFVDSDNEGEEEGEEEEEEEEEEERPHRWKDRGRESKVKERIEETRYQRQAQAQGRRPSLGRSYSWASPRSGDIPVPTTTRDRMQAAIDAAAAGTSPATSDSHERPQPSPRASPGGSKTGSGGGGGGGNTIWHRKARAIRDRSQRSLGAGDANFS